VGSITVHFAPEGRADESALAAMAAAAPHRGPAVSHLVHGQCAVGITSTARGASGIGSSDGIVAAYAGTIDNIHEVTAHLASGGSAQGQSSTADLLAAAFKAYGEDTPRRLRGVYAAVATDGRRLFCFRDHLGLGTLFYRRHGSELVVATEAKQVVSGAGVAKEPDLDVLDQIVFGTYDDRTPTALRGVERLPKATVLTADERGVQMRRYWDPESLLETARPSLDELQGRFDELMTQAVDRALEGDDFVSLSGGVDSPAVAAYAAPRYLEREGRPIPALSAVFPDYPSVDERPYIELAASAFGVELHTYEQRVNPLEDLGYWTQLADGPVPTISLPHYADYFRRIHDLGGRTVLTGEFAELVVDINAYVPQHLLTHGRLSSLRGRLGGNRRSSLKALARLLASPLEPRALTAARWRRRGVGAPTWIDGRKAAEAAGSSAEHAWRRWQKTQVSAFVGPGLTTEAEEICQAVTGVRSRKPWADIDLWELFLSLPAEMKFPDHRSKTLVKRLLRGRVPDEILDRRDKTVFDDSIMANIDYATLRRWIVAAPEVRLDGIDYVALRERLDHEKLELPELIWARNLAAAHAFLGQWSP
jgi:asparagine synthase (glutamine-hydrolysing)